MRVRVGCRFIYFYIYCSFIFVYFAFIHWYFIYLFLFIVQCLNFLSRNQRVGEMLVLNSANCPFNRQRWTPADLLVKPRPLTRGATPTLWRHCPDSLSKPGLTAVRKHLILFNFIYFICRSLACFIWLSSVNFTSLLFFLVCF